MATVATNQIRIDKKNNPDVAEIFAGKQPGDKCQLLVTLTVNENNADEILGSIVKLTKEYGDEEEKEAVPTPEEPIGIEITPMEVDTAAYA